MPPRVVGNGQPTVFVSADKPVLVCDLSNPSIVVLEENMLSVGWPECASCNGGMPKHGGFRVERHDAVTLSRG